MAAPARSIGWIAGWLALFSSPALAGDIASLQTIGFSADGGIFAFEEYGVQDGSGFPYSTLYAIDTKTDRFVAGTPIRQRIDDENASLGTVRAQSLKAAAPLIGRYGLTDNPGLLAAYNPVTEGGDGRTLTYRAHAVLPPVGGPYTLTLENIPLPAAESCKDLAPDTKGFRLAFTQEDGKPSTRLLHQDDRLPESRGCPTDYRIGAVAVHQPLGAPAVHVALVQVLRYGFEGSDGRWIAVPATDMP
ncbi:MULTISPECIES: DUF2259 domain-containing protein [unclassified Rhizobium]|uniref:DUF2259 domain-containing protein n=1 Tax=unclassified Rhizobium TaxID=2613769 RepID=UPI0006F9536D|nr:MULTISPECIES: DUF2259 domain-containing protein [unclassified Rhizobium]KQV34297.1 hypothetical protein ASC86_15250 [Rhizobium sp. Root1212]KRD23675.1 hypothetical protein ASE37_15240 [Rhizobium sp. Root268]